ncbi:MAG: hypothetical protein E6R03_04950 [Hyphomicrobiaceae bacterium]|nr:MAG: hypothetical protein E6R03_04950 [Hyphomicrobiaceae bacterium]
MADYHNHFHHFAISYYEGSRTVKPRGFSQWDGVGEFEDHIGLTKEQYREAKLAYRQGGGKRLMPAFGMIHAPEYASRLGFEVWITTTRPWMRHDSTDPDTRHWLEKHGVAFDHLLYEDPNKYERLAELVDAHRVLFVIDDLDVMLRQAELFLPRAAVVKAERFHNQFDDWHTGAGGLLQVQEILETCKAVWDARDR